MKGTHFFHFFFCYKGSGTWRRIHLYLLVGVFITIWSASLVSSSITKDDEGDIIPPISLKSSAPSSKKNCVDNTKESSEEFLMKLHVCRKNVSITCQIGGNAECHKDREAFKASAIVATSVTKCLIEANTTELKYIRFVIKAKYLKNLNELGSRGLNDEPETQRGRCTLGYTCIDNTYLKDIRVNCFAFHYDANEKPFNGTSNKFLWEAPKNYDGPVFFKSLVMVSYKSFYVDVDTAEIFLPHGNHSS